jgi:hypothetical protein
MNQKSLKIKDDVDNIYKRLIEYNDLLEIIRNQVCEHEESELVNYSWAPGHIMPNTKVCKACGKVLDSNLTVEKATLTSSSE